MAEGKTIYVTIKKQNVINALIIVGCNMYCDNGKSTKWKKCRALQ